VRPSPESGPAPATCLRERARRATSRPDGSLAAALRHRGRPPIPLNERCHLHAGLGVSGPPAKTAVDHSERCCGIPASRARTSVSRYRRCPPSVRIEVSFPAFAHRVTVLGSTRNIVATSAGVNSGSASGVRADICVASPPGPVMRSCDFPCVAWCSMRSLSGMSYMADRDHIAITSGDASTTRRKVSVPGCPVTPPITVTQGDSSDTYRRIAADSEIVSGEAWPACPGAQLASSNSANARHRLCARLNMATASSHSPRAAPSMAAPSSATD
jgi:hypothetical protein